MILDLRPDYKTSGMNWLMKNVFCLKIDGRKLRMRISGTNWKKAQRSQTGSARIVMMVEFCQR